VSRKRFDERRQRVGWRASSQYEEEHAVGDIKKLVGLCVALMMVIIGSIAVATPAQAGKTKIKSTESGSFVSTNFDFDHVDLSSPASYVNGEGISSAGKFTSQSVNEVAPDQKTCTVPGGVANAATEFTFVKEVGVSRSTATGDLLFFTITSGTECVDFSTFPTPPFPFTATETGVVTGGTGKNFGATGTITATSKGAILTLDATGARSFGWFKSSSETTLTGP
jgi:hypothetical protein